MDGLEMKMDKLNEAIRKMTRRAGLMGFALGYVIGMGTAWFIFVQILKWHK